MENLDVSLIDWSRYQFALTALYHWLFVPLTLGITFIIAIMHTCYYRTRSEKWKNITKFWMTLFGINFAIGVATGLILEFEFGTNWANYSWFVGDIFGAPLAIEGIMAFFLETTFVAVMFFGWNKVSKGFHLTSSWLVAIGANLSALWILVANAWMQDPVGMQFNPETARNEMVDFWAVLLSPTAINKFWHTISSGFVTAGIFVVGISSWFLLKKRNFQEAKYSILIASAFGLFGILLNIYTGDGSGKRVYQTQPMKLAAAEGLVYGKKDAPLTIIGFLDMPNEGQNYKDIQIKANLAIPGMLSFLADNSFDTFVPGINDLLEGNKEQSIESFYEKIRKGKIAQDNLLAMKNSEINSDEYNNAKALFYDKDWKNEFFANFGYGYYYDKDYDKLKKNAEKLIPNIPLVFYSFRIMVGLGVLFLLIFCFGFYYSINSKKVGNKVFYYVAVASIPLVWIASMCGWIVAEVGRQPWVVQGLMPNLAAVSQISSEAVKTTFWIFAITFTILLIAEIKIMTKQISKGIKTSNEI